MSLAWIVLLVGAVVAVASWARKGRRAPEAEALGAPAETPPKREPVLRLQIEEPEAEARSLRVDRPVARIGTDAKALVRLEPNGVQRFHAVIEREGDLFRLVDLGTREGTLLNGEPVHRASLGDRDVIQVGRARIVVALEA